MPQSKQPGWANPKSLFRVLAVVLIASALAPLGARAQAPAAPSSALTQLPPAKPLGPLTEAEVERARAVLQLNVTNPFAAKIIATRKAVATPSRLVFHPGDTWGKPCVLHTVQSVVRVCDPIGSPEANAAIAAAKAGKAPAQIVVNRLCIYRWGQADREGFANGASECTVIDGPDGRPTLVSVNGMHFVETADPNYLDYLSTMTKALRGEVPTPGK